MEIFEIKLGIPFWIWKSLVGLSEFWYGREFTNWYWKVEYVDWKRMDKKSTDIKLEKWTEFSVKTNKKVPIF